MEQSATQTRSIGARLDGLTFNRLHLLIFIVLGLGLLFDQMEGSMTGVLAAVFSEQGSNVSRQEFSTMLTVYYVVAAIGAPLMGYVSDRIGRRPALAIALSGFGLLTIGSLLMPGFFGFAAFRVASSFLLSAVPPLAFSYIADTFPPAVRGAAMMLISVMAGLGGALAPMATHWGNDAPLWGLAGWQSAMLIAAVAGIMLGIVTLVLPESPRWLASRSRMARAERALRRFKASSPLPLVAIGSMAALEREAVTAPAETVAAPEEQKESLTRHRGRLSLIVLLLFLQASGLTGFALLLTKALLMKGMGMQEALAQSSIILLMMPLGVIACTFVTDRMGRRTLFMSLALILATSAVVFGLVQDPTLLLVTGLMFSFFMSAFSSAGQIYCAEMFPTGIRGTAVGLGYVGVRAGSACVPILLLPLLLDHGPAAAFSAIAALLLAAGVMARVFGPQIMPRAHLS